MKPDLTTFIAACPADIRSHFQEQTYSFHDKLMEQNKKSDCIYILLNGIVKNYHFEINGNVYIEDIDTGVTHSLIKRPSPPWKPLRNAGC
mgnify:CR=1 FL=1